MRIQSFLFAALALLGSVIGHVGSANAQNCSGSPNPNTICAGPSSGGAGFPNFRPLVPADVPLAAGGLGGSQAGATANQIPVFPGGGGAAVPTSATTWFDNAYCNTIGWAIVRLTGAWTCSKFIAANPVWWGADPTGASDSASAFNSAFAASAAVEFPPGKFKFLSAITYNIPAGINSVTLKGGGQDVTILTWPSGNGLTINYASQNQSAHFRDLSFTTGATSANAALSLLQTGVVAGGAVMAQSDLFRVTFRGDDGYQLTDFWTTSVTARGISNLNFDSVYFQGPSTANGNGIDYAGLTSGSTYAVQMNIAKSEFQNLSAGVIYGSFVQGVSVAQTNFTGCVSGVVSPGSETGTLSQLAISDSQFGQFAAGNSVFTQTAISQVILHGNTFITTAGAFASSAVFLQQASNYSIVGNVFTGSAGASSNGIVIGTQTASTGGTIDGNFIGGYNAGITLQAASARASVQGNQLLGNTTALSNSGTNNFIINNPGYNPVGPSGITVTASPFTYTAGSSPETVYIFGGTVSSVNFDKNGGGLGNVACSASPCTVDLGPFEQAKITYTVLPSANKMVH